MSEGSLGNSANSDVRCPTCGAWQDWSDACRRCRCDLTLLWRVAEAVRTSRRHCLCACGPDVYPRPSSMPADYRGSVPTGRPRGCWQCVICSKETGLLRRPSRKSPIASGQKSRPSTKALDHGGLNLAKRRDAGRGSGPERPSPTHRSPVSHRMACAGEGSAARYLLGFDGIRTSPRRPTRSGPSSSGAGTPANAARVPKLWGLQHKSIKQRFPTCKCITGRANCDMEILLYRGLVETGQRGLELAGLLEAGSLVDNNGPLLATA